MIDVKIKNIDKVIKQLEKYRDSIKGKERQLIKELAEIGIDVASVRFGAAQYDGSNDVIVNGAPEWINETKLAISASGKSVVFIEFGTGVHYTEQHPAAADMGAVRGEYGQGKGSHDSWTYYGDPGSDGKIIRESDKGAVVKTHGNPPTRALYDAGKEMRRRVANIARKVFQA